MANLIRYLLILLFIYLLYRVLRSVFVLIFIRDKRRAGLPRKGVGELVKDPVCNIYVPKSDALSAEVGGEQFYFCSFKCLDQYRKKGGPVERAPG